MILSPERIQKLISQCLQTSPLKCCVKVCAVLPVYLLLSSLNAKQPVFCPCVLQSSLLCCRGLSPPRTRWPERGVSTLLAETSSAEMRSLVCLQSLLSCCRNSLQSLQQSSVEPRPNWSLQSTKTETKSLKRGIKWTSLYPVLKEEGKCVTTAPSGPVLSPSAFLRVAPVTCH